MDVRSQCASTAIPAFRAKASGCYLPSNGGTVTVVNYASAWVALQPYTVRLWAEFAIWDGTKWTGYQKVWASHQYTIDSDKYPFFYRSYVSDDGCFM